MSQILKSYLTLSLVQDASQLVNYGHFLKERTVQIWMSEEYLIFLLKNQVSAVKTTVYIAPNDPAIS